MWVATVKGLREWEFVRLVGVKRTVYEAMVEAVERQHRDFGRPPKLCLGNQVLLCLMYWHEYRTLSATGLSYPDFPIRTFLSGLSYGVSETTAWRIVQKVEIEVSIMRWVDDHNPGWVECQLTDAFGMNWHFVDKLPIFSADSSFDSTSQYPQPGILACEILGGKVDSLGRNISLIDTSEPWSVESVDGTTRFWVFHDLLKKTEPAR
jgi:hypothetical protein